MKGSRFNEEQIIGILREYEAGAKTPEVCRRRGISEALGRDWQRMVTVYRGSRSSKRLLAQEVLG